MDITAITVCVNYSDILENILSNSRFFKKWYIVTSPEDDLTKKLVENANLKCVELLIYPDFYKNSVFNFGGSRRFAQEQIGENELVLMLDADILLPDDFMECLPEKTENDTLYGAMIRIDYPTLDDFINETNPSVYDYSYHFNGFFQLYVSNEKYKYTHSYNCSQTDNYFRDLFPNKIYLKLAVKHLGLPCINWNGRKLN